jgi:hypothetical protein
MSATPDRTCACGRSLAGQPAHHYECRACWYSRRQPRVRSRDRFAPLPPSPADRLQQYAGQLSLFAAPARAAEPEEEPSAFIDWLDQQAGAA